MAFGDFTVDRNSTKYVLGSGGDIISYATDEPAFEFNTDGSYKGLLVEPAATNLALHSENWSTSWTLTGSTITASTEETPDGDTSSKNIVINDNNDSGSGSVQIQQGDPVSANTKYTFSVWLKAKDNNWAQLDLYDAANTTSYRRYFDLQNGVLGSTESVAPDDSQIVAYPNGWYRCSITATYGASAGSFNFYVKVAEADLDSTLTRDGTHSIYAWGAQFEEGPIATSYIPTTTASVTRVKDDITQTGAQSLIGQTEGTLYVEVDWRLTTGTPQYLLSASDGTSNNRIAIYNSGSPVTLRMLAIANGASAATNQGESSTAYSGIQKIAFAYADSDFELYRNGSSISSDTTGSLAALATLTDIDLGQSFAATEQANMHIRAVALYTRRLTDAEAQALTTL